MPAVRRRSASPPAVDEVERGHYDGRNRAGCFAEHLVWPFKHVMGHGVVCAIRALGWRVLFRITATTPKTLEG